MEEIKHLISMVFRGDFEAMRGYVDAAHKKEEKREKAYRESKELVKKIYYA